MHWRQAGVWQVHLQACKSAGHCSTNCTVAGRDETACSHEHGVGWTGRLWGSSQMLQEGSDTALDVAQAQVAKTAIGAFTKAINRSQHDSSLKQGLSIAHHLQQAWQQVRKICTTLEMLAIMIFPNGR